MFCISTLLQILVYGLPAGLSSSALQMLKAFLVMTKTLMVTSKMSENWQKSLEKYIKKTETNQSCYWLMSKELLSPICQGCKKGTKMRHINTQIINIFCFVTICTHKCIQYLLYNRFKIHGSRCGLRPISFIR